MRWCVKSSIEAKGISYEHKGIEKMAERRMFAKSIINSARFLKMPISTQALYFHLGLHADDDGVVEAYPIIRSLGMSEDELKVLVAKGFVVVLNEDLVTYLTDWQTNNKIRPDRKIDSIYKPLLLQVLPDVDLLQKRQRADVKKQLMDDQWTTNGQPMDCIGKDSIGEDSIGKVIIYHAESSDFVPKTANQKGTNTKKTEFIPPTLEEIEEYISAENIANVNAKKFFDHYSDPDRNWKDGKGKKMSNWKLTVRTWSRNDFGSSNQAMAISSNLSKAEQEYAAWGAEQDRILQEKAEKKMNQRKHDDCPF